MVGPEIFNEGRNDGETIFVGRKIILKIFFNFLKNIFTCQISFLAHRLIFILKNEVLDQIKGREWTHTQTHGCVANTPGNTPPSLREGSYIFFLTEGMFMQSDWVQH